LLRAVIDDQRASAIRRRNLPGEHVVDTPTLLAHITDVNSPDVNQVMRAELGGVPDVDGAIAETTRLFRRSPFLWWLGPTDTPADLADRLRAHGLVFLDDIPGMAMDLADLADPADAPPPAELVIRPVLDPTDLAAFHSVLTHGFPEDFEDDTATRMIMAGTASVAAEIGYREPLGPATRWLGTVDGRPVATARLHTGAGVAGIYTVITVGDARRRGYGEAMTRVALHAARDAGLRIATLQASEAGRGIYERIGFRELCRFQLFEGRAREPR
jgi:ribosomal protein S18 acetylase RimI-like enzyme